LISLKRAEDILPTINNDKPKGSVFFVINSLNFAEPMGVMLLFSVVKQAGHDAEFGVATDTDLLSRIEEFKPDIVAFSVMTPEYEALLPLIKEIKSRTGVFTLIGGAHATFFSDIRKEEAIDAVCIGEGERAILEVIDRVLSDGGLEDVNNIVTAEKPVTDMHPLVTDLDSLPDINREIIYDRPEFKGLLLRSFYTNRGCLYNCSYCFNSKYNKLYHKQQIFRRRSVKSIMKEVAEVIGKYPTEFIRFSDDTFLYKDDEWLHEFCAEYKKNFDIPFYVLMRADNVTKDIGMLLKDAGCFSVGMSIEAGTFDIRKKMLNRNISDEKLVTNFRTIKDCGINIKSGCILGLPGTSIEDDIRTIDLAIQSKTDVAGFTVFMPFAGTQLTDYADHSGYLSDMAAGDLFSFHGKSALNCFTEKQKEQQYNLMLLAPIMVGYPRFRNILMKAALKMKPNPAFKVLNVIVFGNLMSHKVFKIKYSLKGFVGTLYRYLKYAVYLKRNRK